MDKQILFEKLLHSFERYYNVTRDISSPYSAMALFINHEEQYVISKSAVLSNIDSTDKVYFVNENILDHTELKHLALNTWEEGLKTVKPYYGHRNSDVSLIILTDSITKEAITLIPKLKFYKSYKFTLFGWSHFRLCVIDGDGNVYTNWMGRDLKKLINRIKQA